MTVSAQGDQVQVVVAPAGSAAACGGHADLWKPQSWHLQPSPQYLFSQVVVRFGIKTQARPFGLNSLHDALSFRKACRCLLGRNIKNRDMDCSNDGTEGSGLIPPPPKLNAPDD